MIRAIILEKNALAIEQLVRLLGDFQQVKIIGTATDGESGLELCDELTPDAVFFDINLSDRHGILLATRLAASDDPPRLVFTAKSSARASYAFRLEAVDYLMKPLDRSQVSEAINRLLVRLRPIEFHSLAGPPNPLLSINTPVFDEASLGLLPVTDLDHDQIRLLAHHEIVSALIRKRRTWIHTVLQEFPAYYPLTQLIHWLKDEPFVQLNRSAIVNLRAIQEVWRQDYQSCSLRLHDRIGTVITISRAGLKRLPAAVLANYRQVDGKVFSR